MATTASGLRPLLVSGMLPPPPGSPGRTNRCSLTCRFACANCLPCALYRGPAQRWPVSSSAGGCRARQRRPMAAGDVRRLVQRGQAAVFCLFQLFPLSGPRRTAYARQVRHWRVAPDAAAPPPARGPRPACSPHGDAVLFHSAPTLAELGVAALVSVPVFHCDEAHGVVIRFHSGFSVAYSGDTRPAPVCGVTARPRFPPRPGVLTLAFAP